MINQQIIDRLAEYMGWEKVIHNKGWRNTQTVLFLEKPLGKRSKTRSFDPINNWNHWREVEEHLMSLQDQSLTFKFLERMTTSHDGTAEGARVYMKATLTQRCDALISVLDSK